LSCDVQFFINNNPARDENCTPKKPPQTFSVGHKMCDGAASHPSPTNDHCVIQAISLQPHHGACAKEPRIGSGGQRIWGSTPEPPIFPASAKVSD